MNKVKRKIHLKSIEWKVMLPLFLTGIILLNTITDYASELNSTLPSYLPISGTWTTQSNNQLKGVSAVNSNAFDMSTTSVGTNFVYEADVTVDASSPYAVGSLVFRSSDDGSKGYVVSLDPNMDRLRLFDFETNTNIGTPYNTTINTGTSYHLKVVADGADIKVYLGDTLAISVNDVRYTSGNVGSHVYNGTAYFQNIHVYETKTNITGWNMTGGTWMTTSQGLKATAASNQNTYAISKTKADNFIYESDIIIQDNYAIGTYIFRSNETGSQAYALQIDPNMGTLRLYNTNGDITLATASVTLSDGKLYHIKIKAEGSTIKVYFQSIFLGQTNGYNPIMTVTDNSYSSGYVGLNAYNGSVLFQNLMISDINTNLNGWTSSGGNWTPNLNGIKAVSTGANDTFRMAVNTASDFVLKGDLTVDASTPLSTAALVFRANSTGSAGYVLNIDPNLSRVRLFNANGGTTIATSNMTITAGKTYHIEVTVNGSSIKVFVDGYATPAISVTDTSYSTGRIGLNAYNGTAYFQNVYVTALNDYSNEMYRPQYHYTQDIGSSSDPNGLVYYQGEYHLFHQDGGKWGHAVSTDLINWKRLPIAIPTSEMGDSWSGSAVVDTNNVSGLFNGGSGLVAFYTIFNPDKAGGNQKIGLAYSIDKGRTWKTYSENPIIQNPGGLNGSWDFRDPKVIWDSEHSEWVMVLSGGDNICFYTSTNLLTWTPASHFGYGDYLHGGVLECPDFFQLPVDGNTSNKKWVLSVSTGAVSKTNGSNSEYFVGTFDGTTFTSDNPASTVLRGEYGKDMYAAQTFSDIPSSDGRRISIGWMSNWDYAFSFPTSPFHGQLSIPRSLSLKTFSEGIRLVQSPVQELNSLRGTASSWNNVDVTSTSPNLLANLSGNAYEIDAVLELPDTEAATEFGFNVRALGDQNTVIGYDAANSQMFVDRSNSGRTDFTQKFTALQTANLSPVNKQVKMHIYVDESSIEVFGNDGKVVFSDIILPNSARDGMSFYSKNGNVKVTSLNVYPLSNTWRYEPTGGTTPEKVVMDSSKLELASGLTQRLYMTVLPRTSVNKNVTWSSSNTSVATVSSVDSRSANVTGVAQGRAVITATTQEGSIVGTTVVNVGAPFNTNLSGWATAPTSPAKWVPTADGIAGYFDQDSNYMSTTNGNDFTYEADLKLDELGGAGSMIFRSDSTGDNGYYLNVDSNLKAIRLFYKSSGNFSDSQLLASVPTFVKSGKTYHMKIVTSGTNIKAYFDGSTSPIIDINDSTYSNGYFGLNVFGGRAYYQNVMLQ